jgi:hypothetical protein
VKIASTHASEETRIAYSPARTAPPNPPLLSIMSGSHQFYTVTGRALPLPPKRAPSRHSTVLRLPTRRAEQERSTTVRADSPGRIEAPHGGEFRNIPKSQRAASQLVVYQGGCGGCGGGGRQPEGSVNRGPDAAVAAAAVPSLGSSNADHGSRPNSSFNDGPGTAAAEVTALPPSSHASSVAAGRSPLPRVSHGWMPSNNDSTASSNGRANENHRSGVYKTATAPTASDEDHSTPKARSAQIVRGGSDDNSSSDSSSPCLNRVKSEEGEDDDIDMPVNRRNGADHHSDVDMEKMQLISMSGTRQSRAPKEREQGDTHRAHQQQVQRQQPKVTHNDRSVTSQSSVSQYSVHLKGSTRDSLPHERATPLQQARSQHLRSLAPPDVQRAQHATAISQRSELGSYRQGPPSCGYAGSETSSCRPATSEKGTMKQHQHQQQQHSGNHGEAAMVAVSVSPIVPRTNRVVNGSISDSSNRPYYNPNMSIISNGNTHHSSVDRHDHLYSQQKMEERRASRPVADASHGTSCRPPAGSQALALVPTLAVAKYTRSPRSDDDPLEMNTPIADRVRQRSLVSPAHRITSSASAAAVTPAMVGMLEGTELMPSLPRLQGRKKNSSEDDDRTYRTIVRFIEYQPEAERPALEEMLRDFRGREDELCELLTETYGEDFEMLKSACHRGPSVPLISYRPNNPLSAAASQCSDSASRVLLLREAAAQQENGSHRQNWLPEHEQDQEQQTSYATTGEGDDRGSDSDHHDYAVALQSGADSEEEAREAAEYHCEEYRESSQAYSTPRVEEGVYDEEPVYEVENYAREMLTPALPYDRR